MELQFDSPSVDHIRDHLIARNQNVAVAESVTAGFLQAALASADKAMNFFEGGVTAYNIDQKVRHLDIDRQLGTACNCVSEEIAKQMANGVIRLFKSNWGISVTGYATPVPESNHQLFAYYAIGNQEGILESQRILLQKQTAEEAQLQYVNYILKRFGLLFKH